MCVCVGGGGGGGEFEQQAIAFLLFLEIFGGDKAVMEEDKVVIGGSPQAPHRGKPCQWYSSLLKNR